MNRAIPVLVALSVLALSGAAAGVAMGLGNGPCGSRIVDVPETRSDDFDVTFLGDTMLGDAATPQLAALGYDWAFAGAAGIPLGDFVMANAEGPITTRTEPFDPAQHWHYNALPDAAPAMRTAGLDAVSLANNHAMDRGPQGLADTISNLQASGIAPVGAGPSTCEAELPLIVRTPVGTLGIVALGKYYGRDKMASLVNSGTIALSRASIERGAQLARSAGADWIVAFVHWGRSYDAITPEQRHFADDFEEAGYDLVIGAHPHVAQAIESTEDMPVAYSLGNYVFGAPGRFSPERPGNGLVVDAVFASDGLRELRVRCLDTDNKVVDYQARLCTPAEAAAVLPHIVDKSAIQGDVGVLPVP